MKRNDKTRKKPCAECPYKLGQVHTVANPCPECELNGYQSYEWFRKQHTGESTPSRMGAAGESKIQH